jgi:hypothetical protein
MWINLSLELFFVVTLVFLPLLPGFLKHVSNKRRR